MTSSHEISDSDLPKPESMDELERIREVHNAQKEQLQKLRNEQNERIAADQVNFHLQSLPTIYCRNYQQKKD
jgi:hypothetical protein